MLGTSLTLTIHKPPNTNILIPSTPSKFKTSPFLIRSISQSLPNSAISMANFRSKSQKYTDKNLQLDRHNDIFGFEPRDFRSYSVSYASSSYKTTQSNMDIVVSGTDNNFKLKKGKSTNGSTSKSWRFSDPEFQRKKRVAGYKVYSVEERLKGSFRKSFRWLKDKYTNVVYG